MAEAALKQAKIDRRTAKSAFTRAGKSVLHTVGSNRPPDEVSQALTKLQGAYESLVTKHEEYAKLIDDEEDYQTEEQWLAECQETFMKLEVDAKMFVENVKLSESKGSDGNGAIPADDSVVNTIDITQTTNDMQEQATTSVDTVIQAPDTPIVNSTAQSHCTNQSGACTFKLEKPKLPIFTGDVRDYAIFRSDFKHAIEAKYPKRDAITLLRTCLRDKPLELIKGIGTDYDAAWEYLDSIYGDPRFVSDTVTQDIVKFKALQEGEDTRFCDLVHLVKRCWSAE